MVLTVQASPDGDGGASFTDWWRLLHWALAGPGPVDFALRARRTTLGSADVVQWLLNWRAQGSPTRCLLDLRETSVGDEGLAALIGGVPASLTDLSVRLEGTRIQLDGPLPVPPATVRRLCVTVDAARLLQRSPPWGWCCGDTPPHGTPIWYPEGTTGESRTVIVAAVDANGG